MLPGISGHTSRDRTGPACLRPMSIWRPPAEVAPTHRQRAPAWQRRGKQQFSRVFWVPQYFAKYSPKVLQRIGMLAGRMGFADVRKGMSPQMHHKCTTQGQCLGRLFNLGCLYCKRKCRLVLSGAHGGMVQFGNFLPKQGVVGEVFAQPLQPFSRSESVLMPKIIKSQENTSKRHEKTTVIGNQRQLFYTLLLITFES